MWSYVRNWSKENKYLLAIVVLVTALLLYRINYRTFWGDETAVLAYLTHTLTGFLTAYWQQPDNHPPLYYFLVLITSKMFPWTELTIRLTSVLAGLGIVCLVYEFSNRIMQNKKIAFVASFFTAFSSYFILISQMARYHSLAGFFSLLTFYFFYRLWFEENKKSFWYWCLAGMTLVGYTDYAHFFYVALLINIMYLYSLLKHKPVLSFRKWVLGQLVVALLLSPLVWLIYHRVAVQGDGGWNNINLLANSPIHIVAAIFFHIYSFFFGENIFPWNYAFFLIGTIILAAVLAGLVNGIRKKWWDTRQLFIVFLAISIIVVNTLFMNVADPRYNFIVYPKFGFVAYPLCVMVFVFCLYKLSFKIRTTLFLLWIIVASFGLWNFYQAKNYLNPSYFRTFESYEYLRDHSKPGQFMAINANSIEGFYNFYQTKYFFNTTPINFNNPDQVVVASQAQIWFLSVSSEGADSTVDTDNLVPVGYRVLDRFDTVPLDPTFKKLKERTLHRPSYTYKYTLFLLEKI